MMVLSGVPFIVVSHVTRSESNSGPSERWEHPFRSGTAEYLALGGQPTLRLSADSFPRLLTTSYWTICPSLRELSPARSTAEIWTNTSLPPSCGGMNPYPLVGLNHFTVPVAIF